MPYTPTAWEDFPSTDTAITAARLNNMEAGILNADTVLSVRSYGAVGNGVADDTAEIQAALTAGADAAVYVPPGTYLTTAKLNISSGTHLFGAGAASVIKSDAISSAGDLPSNPGHTQVHANAKTGFRITDLTFDASGMTSFTHGMRSVMLQDSSDFHVARCRFLTPGAATAALGCSNYWITDNYVSMIADDAESHHDGIIDNWGGSHGFVIRGNTILCNAVLTPYGILVTGVDTGGSADACYDFQIVENTVFDADGVGIWVNGLTGINHDFAIANNNIQRVATFYGLAVSDARRFSVTGNTVQTTAAAGIMLFQQTAFGGQSATITGNVVADANTSAGASSVYTAGIGIADNSTGISVVGNRVNGTAHGYGVFLADSTSNCEVVGENYAAGTTGVVYNTVTSNRVPSGGIYTPTLTGVANVASSTAFSCRWKREGNVVTVNGRVDVVPTAAGFTVTQLGISLPIASAFASNNTDCSGIASTLFNQPAGIEADVANDRAQFGFQAQNTSNNLFFFTFQYTVI